MLQHQPGHIDKAVKYIDGNAAVELEPVAVIFETRNRTTNGALEGRPAKRVIVVPGKLVNIVG